MEGTRTFSDWCTVQSFRGWTHPNLEGQLPKSVLVRQRRANCAWSGALHTHTNTHTHTHTHTHTNLEQTKMKPFHMNHRNRKIYKTKTMFKNITQVSEYLFTQSFPVQMNNHLWFQTKKWNLLVTSLFFGKASDKSLMDHPRQCYPYITCSEICTYKYSVTKQTTIEKKSLHLFLSPPSTL